MDITNLRGTKRESIRRINGYTKDAYTYVPVLIVGAGESGIAMGCRLKDKLGFDQFRIYERQSGIGGTWWINRYPGVACDIPSIFYSFSFAQNPNWTSFFPAGPEIQRYLTDVCAKYQIDDKIQLNTDVQSCQWLEDEQLWEVKLNHLAPGVGDLSYKDKERLLKEKGPDAVIVRRETVRAKIVCSAVGGLVEPNAWPKNVPGIEKFNGPVFHSARWEDHHDFKDKDIVVVGTGCSAAQFVPKLVQAPYHAKSVTQLMRSPPWVAPRAIPPGGDKGYNENAPALYRNIPGLQNTMRLLISAALEADFLLFGSSERAAKARLKYEDELKAHIKSTTPEKYHEILTPNYGVGCKRRIFDATWYPGLNDPKIDLSTQPLTEVHENSVTIGPGRTYPDPKDTSSTAPTDKKEIPADMIIMANGFDMQHWLQSLTIIGKDDITLTEQMDARGGAQAYQGTAMDGFPNFFMLFGPNAATGHTSVILASEHMVNYSLKFISKILNGDVATVDVKKEAEIAYTQKLQAKLKTMVWQSGGCHSWYITDGWNSSIYPWTQAYFAYRSMFPKWRDWNIQYTRKGLLKERLRSLFEMLAFASLLWCAFRLRKTGIPSWSAITGIGRYTVSMAIGRTIQALRTVQSYV